VVGSRRTGFRLQSPPCSNGVTDPDDGRLPIGVSRTLWREGPGPPPRPTMCGGGSAQSVVATAQQKPRARGRSDGDNRATVVALFHARQAASTSSRRACWLPDFVVGPRRRRSPEECSDGVTPRKLMTCAACAKRWKSPISAHIPAAVRVSMPRLNHVGTPIIAVGARPPLSPKPAHLMRGCRPSHHAPDRPAAQDDGPYGLAG